MGLEGRRLVSLNLPICLFRQRATLRRFKLFIRINSRYICRSHIVLFLLRGCSGLHCAIASCECLTPPSSAPSFCLYTTREYVDGRTRKMKTIDQAVPSHSNCEGRKSPTPWNLTSRYAWKTEANKTRGKAVQRWQGCTGTGG